MRNSRDQLNGPADDGQTWTHSDDPEAQPTGEYKIGLAEKAHVAQDRLLVMERQGVFAIFDGMGGEGGPEGGAIASNLAAETVWNKYANEYDLGRNTELEISRLMEGLAEADRVIASRGDIGTTAVVVRMMQAGDEFRFVWASVGDSRLYLYRDEELNQISVDEGEGHAIYNYLGSGRVAIRQFGDIALKDKDKIMICSDGITGDYGSDILSPAEIEEALRATTPQEAANRLLQRSRKRDDKSVIVLDIAAGEMSSSALIEHIMKHDECLPLDPWKPLESRGNYNVLAQITAGQKEFMLLDLRPAPIVGDKKIPFGESIGHWDADLLLVDETFFGEWGAPQKGQGGYKGIMPGSVLEFGRSQENNYGRFDMPVTTSRDHFAISYSGEEIHIINRQPENPTIVTLKK